MVSFLVLIGSPTEAEHRTSPLCNQRHDLWSSRFQSKVYDPEIWDIDGSGDASIQGFATDISVNVGQRIDFKIDTAASSYSIDIYRMGYYADRRPQDRLRHPQRPTAAGAAAVHYRSHH